MPRTLLLLLFLPLTVFSQREAHTFTVTPSGGVVGELRMRELAANGSNYIAHKAANSLASTASYTWPVPSAGCVSVDGSGVVSFAACAAAPFIDSTAIIKGSADATKLLAFEVDGFTTATTRTVTVPNASFTMAGIDIAQTWTSAQSFGQNLTMLATGAGPTVGSRAIVLSAINSGGSARQGAIYADSDGNVVFQTGNPASPGGFSILSDSSIAVNTNIYINGNTFVDASRNVTAASLAIIGGSFGITSAGNATVNDLTINGTCTGCGSGLPVVDTTEVVTGSINTTRRLRLEADNISNSTTRVWTAQDANITVAGTNVNNSFSVAQTFNSTISVANTINTVSGGYDVGSVNVISSGRALQNITSASISGNVAISGDFSTTAGGYVINGVNVISSTRAIQNVTSISSTGNISASHVAPSLSSTYSLGSGSFHYLGAFIDSITAFSNVNVYDTVRNRVSLTHPGTGSDTGNAITVLDNAGTTMFRVSYNESVDDLVGVNGRITVTTGYKSGGNVGLTAGVTVKGSDGNDCVISFHGGIYYADTCP